MSSSPRRPKFPLTLDSVVERKPAPARTAGLPAIVGKRAATPAPAPTPARRVPPAAAPVPAPA
ncbi:protein-L-isoaspartate O-methyltransferase, partial [Cupriavidus gilardii]|nr:protein-L-isoaspartate O-methyltransferase [Cupriavidus gilardii]